MPGLSGLRLERRVLAKLMMLEYIRPVFFRDLAALQAAEGDARTRSRARNRCCGRK